MSVVKINAIDVPAEMGAHLEERFAARAHLVEGMPGFEGFELLRPVSGDTRYFVVTHWADDESFQAWVNSESFQKGHARPEGDGPAVAPQATLLEFEVVEFATPVESTPES